MHSGYSEVQEELVAGVDCEALVCPPDKLLPLPQPVAGLCPLLDGLAVVRLEGEGILAVPDGLPVIACNNNTKLGQITKIIY